MTTLITFLGRSSRGENGYRKTCYSFTDGTHAEVEFFGWALQQRLHPDRTVVFGTAGSMWEYLFESVEALSEDERLKLLEDGENHRVTQEQLDLLEPLLSEERGCQLRLRIIPYCRDRKEQVELLRRLADEVGESEQIELDITHGFRHLPLLALVSALYLVRIKRVTIRHIWYGAFDQDTQKAPVHDLAGLLDIVDWLEALTVQQHSGNYGVFAPLLEQAGFPQEQAKRLREAAYFENVLNTGDATGRLREILGDLEHNPPQSPEAMLMLPIMRDRLSWVSEGKQFEKQLALAEQALARGDYLRATLYAYESVITRLCQQRHAPISDFNARKEAIKEYEDHLEAYDEEWQDYRLLKNLRNQVAHGSRGARGDVQKALLTESRMRETLARLIERIKTGKLPGQVTEDRA